MTTQNSTLNSEGFSYGQVIQAFVNLFYTEANLIVDNVLPPQSSLLGDVYARMSFDDMQFISVDLLSQKQVDLILKHS